MGRAPARAVVWANRLGVFPVDDVRKITRLRQKTTSNLRFFFHAIFFFANLKWFSGFQAGGRARAIFYFYFFIGIEGNRNRKMTILRRSNPVLFLFRPFVRPKIAFWPVGQKLPPCYFSISAKIELYVHVQFYFSILFPQQKLALKHVSLWRRSSSHPTPRRDE